MYRARGFPVLSASLLMFAPTAVLSQDHPNHTLYTYLINDYALNASEAFPARNQQGWWRCSDDGRISISCAYISPPMLRAIRFVFRDKDATGLPVDFPGLQP